MDPTMAGKCKHSSSAFKKPKKAYLSEGWVVALLSVVKENDTGIFCMTLEAAWRWMASLLYAILAQAGHLQLLFSFVPIPSHPSEVVVAQVEAKEGDPRFGNGSHHGWQMQAL